MSDVPVRCSTCGNEICVSEFIAPEALKCSNCGGQLILDKTKGEGPVRRLTVKREKAPDPTAAKPGNATPPEKSKVRSILRRRHQEGRMRKIGKVRISDYAVSWFLFLTLTPVLCMLRYVEFLSESDLESYIFGGQIAFVIFYLVIFVEAIREETFDGILCFFLPPYTIYYLFFKSNSFCLRALIVALLAGFGYDLTMTTFHTAAKTVDYVAWWINEGALGP